MSVRPLEKELLQIPDLPMLLDRLRVLLAEEAPAREAFRMELTPDIKAEFINGTVVMHSPASEDHNEATGHLFLSMGFYANLQNLGKVRIEKALVGFTRNDYEPDVAFWRKEVADLFRPDMNVYPVPDLIVEVLSPGSENVRRDTEIKKADYAAHRVPEYWIVDPKQQTIEQHLLSTTVSGVYELHKKVAIDDWIESTVLRGFRIPVKAVFDAGVNAAVVKGWAG